MTEDESTFGIADPPSPRRERLPKRRLLTQRKVVVGGHGLIFGVGFYPDGRPGEIWIELAHREGAPLRTFAHCLAMSVSIGLQYGVPARAFVEQFRGTAFDPAGDVEGDDDVSSALSIVDYIAQALEAELP